MTANDGIRASFATLLEAARDSYANYVRSTGLQFTMFKQRTALEPNPDGWGWHTAPMTVEESTSKNHVAQWALQASDLKERLLALASDISDTHIARPPFPPAGFVAVPNRLIGLPHTHLAEFASEPEVWLVQHMLGPAIIEYLTSLRSAASPDRALSEKITTEALNLAVSEQLVIVHYIPVAGLSTEDEFLAAGDLTVRRLTPLEKGELWLQRDGGANLLDVTFLADIWSFHNPPTHVIGLTVKRPRIGPPDLESPMLAALCAFYLHGYTLSGSGVVTARIQPSWHNTSRSGSTVPFREQVDNLPALSLDNARLENVWLTLLNLYTYRVTRPGNAQDLALHRFLLGSSRDDPVDALLDYVIALECLLLPGERTELSYRFRLHGAHYLGSSTHEREGIWTQLKGIYEMRSRLVHGPKYPRQDEVGRNLPIARDLAREALLRAVHSHFPTMNEFTSWARDGHSNASL